MLYYLKSAILGGLYHISCKLHVIIMNYHITASMRKTILFQKFDFGSDFFKKSGVLQSVFRSLHWSGDSKQRTFYISIFYSILVFIYIDSYVTLPEGTFIHLMWVFESDKLWFASCWPLRSPQNPSQHPGLVSHLNAAE